MGASDQVDVIVVGAGPVGLAVAALLGRAGHSVRVIERYRSLFGLPRAIRFDGEAMRLFQTLGIVEEIAEEIVPADNYVWYGADGGVILDIDSRAPARSGWAASYSFWQPTLETALQDVVLNTPMIDLLRGWAVEDVEQDRRGARVTVRQGGETKPGRWIGGETTETLSARYVIGADGANSTVRRGASIDLEDFGFSERWLVLDVRPHDMTMWTAPPVASQRCDPRRPTVVVRNGAHHRRWEFMLLPGEPIERFRDPAVAWELLAPYLSPHEGTIVRQAVYEFTGTLAQTFRHGRLLLAGDAAHTMPPFMAEGMCTGLRDATNLAWRLDLVLRGRAATGLLNAYTTERRPHARRLIELSIEMGKVSCTIDPAAAAARDAAFRSGAVPPPPPMPGLLEGTLQSRPRPGEIAGQLAVQGRITTHDGRTGRADDLLGPGFTLVALHGDPGALLDDEQRDFLAGLPTHLVALDPSLEGAVVDADGALIAWMSERGISAFLARPDGYAHGAVSDPSEIPSLVDELRGQLADPHASAVADRSTGARHG